MMNNMPKLLFKILDVEIYGNASEWWFFTANGNRHAQQCTGVTEKEMLQTAKLSIMKSLGYSDERMESEFNGIKVERYV